jgi:hypothetical protein
MWMTLLLWSTAALAANADIDLVYEAVPGQISLTGLTVAVSTVTVDLDLQSHLSKADKVIKKAGVDASDILGVAYNGYHQPVLRFITVNPLEDELRSTVRSELAALGAKLVDESASPDLTYSIEARDFFFESEPKFLKFWVTFVGDLEVRIAGKDGLVWSGRVDHTETDKSVCCGKSAMREAANVQYAVLIQSVVRQNQAALQAIERIQTK